MHATYSRAASENELQQILALQKKNAIKTVSAEEKEREGFVTVSHSYDILKQMNDPALM